MEKMLHGATDAIQLQAAELVARLTGMIGQPAAPSSGAEIGYRGRNGRGTHGETRAPEPSAETLDD
jgi:hypothetical protein